MAKLKIFELKNIINEQARLKLESKDIQDFLETRFGVKKTHSSNLEDNEVRAVKEHFIKATSGASAAPADKSKASTVAKATAAKSADVASAKPADGTVRPAQGAARMPGAKSADVASSRPAGAAARPVGQGARMPGSEGKTGVPTGTARPVGGTARPVGGATRMPGSEARPVGGTARPVGGVPRMPGSEARPVGGTARPAGGAARPVGGVPRMPGSETRPAGGAARMPGSKAADAASAKPTGQAAAQKPQAGQKSQKHGSRSSSSSHNGVWQRPISERHLGLPTTKPAASDSTVPSGAGTTQIGETGQVTDKRMTAELLKTDEKTAVDAASKAAADAAVKQETISQKKDTDDNIKPAAFTETPEKAATDSVDVKEKDQKDSVAKQTAAKQADASAQAQKPQTRQPDSAAQARKQEDTVQTRQRDGGAQTRQRDGGAQSRQRDGGAQTRQHDGGAQSRQRDGASQSRQRDSGTQARQRDNSSQARRQTGDTRRSEDGRQRGYHDQRSSAQQGNTRTGADSQGRQRPYNQDRTQGRPAQDGQRPYGQRQGDFSRDRQGDRSRDRQGDRQGAARTGGFMPKGFEIFKKDEDDRPAYQKQGRKSGPGQRGPSDRKNFDQQILEQKVAEKNDFNNRRSRDRVNKDKLYKEKGSLKEIQEEEKTISKLMPKKGQFIKPKPVEPKPEEEIKVITIPETITIKHLAEKMKMPSGALVKKLFLEGKMVSINQEITYEEAEEIALEFEIICEREVKVNEIEVLLKDDEDDPATLVKRPPVVCVMGHVDHGKTSLLDAIRETNVTAREAGGITQHIGAYTVDINGEQITFLDTPGHEAFTSMRMRGAQATDIAILVVAADDGVMPQTIEAISHAKAAGVQIIVAVNKIDKPSANVERVKQELTEYGLIAEDWGGDTIFAPVSAHTKEGIEHLLEMIILASEMLELKANPNRKARGLIIEAELDKGRGPVATILVQKGTLRVGDNLAVGSTFGKVRAMMDDKGRKLKEATPSTPVEILGLNGVPNVGEIFVATESEKEARTIAEAYISQGKERLIADTKTKLSLDGLFSQIQAGNIKELNLIVKADVQGSVEAMKQSLLKLSNEEVAVRVLHGGVGAINESDVILASTSNAIIIGFNVKPDNIAKETADREKIDIKLYKVIYNAINDIEAAMKGMLDPVYEEKVIGHAEVRQTFKASGIGTIAGSYVTDGRILRGCKSRIFRGKSLIYEGSLASLKRFQDDVKEVASGFECGLVFNNFNDIAEGDKVELYMMVEVPR